MQGTKSQIAGYYKCGDKSYRYAITTEHRTASWLEGQNFKPNRQNSWASKQKHLTGNGKHSCSYYEWILAALRKAAVWSGVGRTHIYSNTCIEKVISSRHTHTHAHTLQPTACLFCLALLAYSNSWPIQHTFLSTNHLHTPISRGLLPPSPSPAALLYDAVSLWWPA